MNCPRLVVRKLTFIFALVIIALFNSIAAQPVADSQRALEAKPIDTSSTFKNAIAGFHALHTFRFGQSAQGSEAIRNITDLQQYFTPYGIAGHIVINREWQRYQPFNDQNFSFVPSALNITALIPSGGGLRAGGITSGQIWSRDTFLPGRGGQTAIAISVRMRTPDGAGGWPAVWIYTKEPGKNDASEIDNPEFFNETNQNQFDWTGYQHGPGLGRTLYSIMTNKWVWHPGTNFSADYHDYQTLWTKDAVYKYVDGKLILAQAFKWTSKGSAQLGIDLAVGTDDQQSFPGLQPKSPEEFPMILSVQSIEIWSK